MELPDELIEIVMSYCDFKSLCAARLVSHLWCAIATEQLFDQLTMIPTNEGIVKWEAVLNTAQLSRHCRHLVINSNPLPGFVPWESTPEEDAYANEALDKWRPYQCRDCRQASYLKRCNYGEEEDQYRSYYNSFCDIAKLPKLEKVCMHFNEECATEEWMSRVIGFENPQRRDDQLHRLFRALQERLEHPGLSSVTALCIQNLQNVSFTPDTLEHYHAAISTIEQLELLVTEERNHFDGSDSFQYPETRRAFMSHLETIWLVHLASRLKSLSLSFHFYWGALPGRFNGHDLHFPQLQDLILEKYCLSHNDAISWILKQSSLKHLRLRNCAIVAYFKLWAEYIEECDVSLDDWTEGAHSVTGWYMSHMLYYHYSTTWDYFLDRVRLELPCLRTFVFEYSDTECDRNSQTATDPCSIDRYIAYDAGTTYPGPWMKPTCHDCYESESESIINCKLCTRPLLTQDKDDEALARLLEDVAARQSRDS